MVEVKISNKNIMNSFDVITTHNSGKKNFLNSSVFAFQAIILKTVKK